MWDTELASGWGGACQPDLTGFDHMNDEGAPHG